MRRDLSRLTSTTFDLLVVGAGIYGACAAWDACLRGLSVAIVDRDDFGAATSANSLRIVHGGLRYLARGDFLQMRESIRERSTLLRIAPELVEPLPVLVPTYGGIPGWLAHGLALGLNDLMSWYRNRHLGPDRAIPRGRLVSRDECLRLFPEAATVGLSGGALWYDAQLRHPERLTLSFVDAAAEHGAIAANYVQVERLITRDGAVTGARTIDCLTGSELDIQARAVLVAAGPWTQDLVATTSGTARPLRPTPRQALGMNLVIRRRLADVAVGLRAHSSRGEDPICGGRRYLFFAPQGEASLLGTWYTVAGAVDPRTARERGIRALLQEFNDACPALELMPDEIVRCQWGWLPLKSGLEPGRPDALAERPRLVDYGRRHGIRHLLSVEGVKYTTARRVAEQAIDRVFVSLARQSPPCRTAEVRLPTAPTGISPVSRSPVTTREILHAVREEMAVKLTDVVFRRTTLGAVPGPARGVVETAARVAGAELGWDVTRQEAEIEAVMRQTGLPNPAMESVG